MSQWEQKGVAMSQRDEIFSIIPERFTVGLSSIVGVTAFGGQNSVMLRYISGGSLEIGGTYAAASGATTPFTWGKGYLVSSNEIAFNQMGTFYMAATGSTTVVHVLRFQAPGADN
jgi:hypothetical protein